MQLVCACRGSRLVWVFLCNESESLVDNNTTTLDTPPILSLHEPLHVYMYASILEIQLYSY